MASPLISLLRASALLSNSFRTLAVLPLNELISCMIMTNSCRRQSTPSRGAPEMNPTRRYLSPSPLVLWLRLSKPSSDELAQGMPTHFP
ncbi:hypothetical protein BJY52DRAFT_1284248 [Lactarius psammicola]|nr:hypothetical protein BJY52DRAFT_1284248 [Lactarius psammicola]